MDLQVLTLVCASSPVCRDAAETQVLVGYFVNMLVMRTDMSGNPSFLDLLQRVQGVVRGAFVHCQVCFRFSLRVQFKHRNV
jgi:non-ribosomal peptide synthetase component F